MKFLALAEAISSPELSSRLVELDLAFNKISAEPAAALCAAAAVAGK